MIFWLIMVAVAATGAVLSVRLLSATYDKEIARIEREDS